MPPPPVPLPPSAPAPAPAPAAPAPSAPSSSPSRVTLPVGGYVKLQSLQAKPELNGKVGTLGEYDGTSGRYLVTLRDGTALSLKRTNLLQMLTVRLIGLEPPLAHHNGEEGTIFEYDAASGLYGIEMAISGDAIPVGPGCALLPEGAVATVQGLQGAPQYNGQLARVSAHEETSGRYTCYLEDEGRTEGKVLKLKRHSLLV